MAKAKFNLIFNGEEIRTLKELQKNFDVEEILNTYNKRVKGIDGTEERLLVRWLDCRDYTEQLEQVKNIQTENAIEVAKELMRILDTSGNISDIDNNISVFDYVEARRKFWTEQKSVSVLEKKLTKLSQENIELTQTQKNLQLSLSDANKKIAELTSQLSAVTEQRDALSSELYQIKSVLTRELEEAKKQIGITNDTSTEIHENQQSKTVTAIEKLKIAKSMKTSTSKKATVYLYSNISEIEPTGKFYVITDVGNCHGLLIYNYKSKSDIPIEQACKNQISLDGIFVRKNSQYANYENTYLYFYYKEL